MPRWDVNRSGEMEVFIHVVEKGGFSAAARATRMSPSAVSKLVARLEHRLGARLVNRSTRKFQLTPEGCAYYERAKRILADLDEAERIAAGGERPEGRIRINTSASFGVHILMPLLSEFLTQYPGVQLDIVQTDAVVDLMSERVDVAVRAGPMKSSNLVARRLGATPMMIVAAPSYVARAGKPTTISELESHNCISLCYPRALEGWPLLHGDQVIRMATTGTVQTSDGEALRHLALAGVGLARLAAFTIVEDVAAGRLVPVMEEFNPGDLEETHAVYLGQGGLLPARVRVLLDFLAERARIPQFRTNKGMEREYR